MEIRGLKIGLNKITIEVISKDDTQKNIYTINVTRTADSKKANANLETLAIEYFTIEPQFSPNNTQYNINVSNTTEKVNIFAVPESTAAKVDIKNKDTLNFGENEIVVTVTAENGITFKNYIIKVYRMTAEENEEKIKEQEANAKKLGEILEEKEIERLSTIQEQNNNNNNLFARISPVIALLVVLAILIIYLIVTKKIVIFKKSL